MSEITVNTPKGAVTGFCRDGCQYFLGIPYAKPPLGIMRFKVSEEHGDWKEPLKADHFSPVFVQRANRVAEWIGTVKDERSEDALTLNLFVPDGEGPFPILLWIHGGAWFSQGASQPTCDGAFWAKEGRVIIATLNYRLGPWGFMYYPGLIEPNLGFKDCALALKVLRKIAPAFGGDVENITVAGQSAGGYMTYMLAADPKTNGLFHKAIPMSAPLTLPLRPLDLAARMSGTVFDALGIEPKASDALEKLQQAPVEALLDAGEVLAKSWMPRFKDDPKRMYDMPWIPACEGYADHEDFLNSLVKGLKERRMPVLFGSVVNEYSFCSSTHDLLSDRSIGRVMFEDLSFSIALLSGTPSYAYYFTFGDQNTPAYACHCADLPVLFNTWEHYDGLVHRHSDPQKMRRLSQLMQRCWSRFMYEGRPDDEEKWPAYTAQSLKVRRLDGEENGLFTRF